MTTLSIIIPCYNCERTLEEAVGSIYAQEPLFPFDVTMVDDGSSDGTYKLMQHLAQRFPHMKIVRHSANLGGGAARNTAVANSDGDLIFCLDSDDMLGPDFFKNMTRFWLEKRCDGVGISRSVKFRKADIKDVAYVTEFEGPGQRVRFESLFDSSACSLFSTFLISRKAFDLIGGYPTSHGFDTQGMAFRFLCNGLTAYTCPETLYYHRVQYDRSYFLREAAAGRTHWNWFKILEEFLYLFTDQVKITILDHEYFPPGPLPTIESVLRVMQERGSIYSKHFEEFLQLGRDRTAARIKDSPNRYDQYWVGSYHLSRGQHAEALDHFVKALKAGFDHRIIYCSLLDAAAGTSGSKTPAKISIGDLIYHVNDAMRTAESSAPPLSAYQRFENWLFRHGALSMIGSTLKLARLLVRRLSGAGDRHRRGAT